jgi:phosphoribosylanthranilate isomerase
MVLVKICGLKDLESAQVALDSGADLLGMILVPNRARTVEIPAAKQISQLVQSRRPKTSTSIDLHSKLDRTNWTLSVHDNLKQQGPFLVGVFRNQSVEEINSLVDEIGLDFVQLHGSEPRKEYISKLSVPVITRFVPNDPEIETASDPDQILSLFDSEAGGEGIKLNWDGLGDWAKESNSKFVLAGGLTPDNVSVAVRVHGVIGVDVSGGVETDGIKDHQKIRDFIKNAKESSST